MEHFLDRDTIHLLRVVVFTTPNPPPYYTRQSSGNVTRFTISDDPKPDLTISVVEMVTKMSKPFRNLSLYYP